MDYKSDIVKKTSKTLHAKLPGLKDKKSILRSPELHALYDHLKTLPAGKARADFGKEVNALKTDLEKSAQKPHKTVDNRPPIDITAPFGFNVPLEQRPGLLPVENGSKHPVMSELEKILDIFARMGFSAIESRELDDDWHMFTSLNFPPDHPARADYDTFTTTESLIAPAHTSTMQNRVLTSGREGLANGRPIAAVIPGRVFRNEDLDARHEHTFYQLEGIYVDRGVNAGHLIATLKSFLEEYYGQSLEVKTQPFYFPFTEPSFEFVLSCPFCAKAGCHICSHTGWIELLGCGMIHPNVLKMAKIDGNEYSGFAWGMGIERLVMMKYGIEDIRYFQSGNLKFLRQFS